MKTIVATLVVLAALTSSALADSCVRWLDRFDVADREDLLPGLGLEPSPYVEGQFTITNLPEIDAALLCRDGELVELGSTLTAEGEADRTRFFAFASYALMATDGVGTVSNVTSLLATLLDEAATQSERNEIRTGTRSGGAEQVAGAMNVRIEIAEGSISFRLSRL